MAIDLGSARTRAWTAGRHGILDVPTATGPDDLAAYPVQRGTIVDPAGTARMLSRLLAHRIPRNAQPVIAFTMPVLSGQQHHTTAVGVLQVLRPRTVLALDSVMAIALGRGADPFRPLPLIDVGFHLTEVALPADGELRTARREAIGTRDLEDGSPVDLATGITAVVTTMMRDDPLPQFVDALDRGPLLAGGGALRPELVSPLSAQLHAPVQPVPQPHTAAVRGAAQARRGRTIPTAAGRTSHGWRRSGRHRARRRPGRTAPDRVPAAPARHRAAPRRAAATPSPHAARRCSATPPPRRARRPPAAAPPRSTPSIATCAAPAHPLSVTPQPPITIAQ
ncbi:hypothetical protein [Streptomyces sp. NPDC006334]|uniref:hypothetical protein n=1 Tax=Streptomyces sp. NPDC006334 TaxID=3156754 RepID=UPI00339FD0B0